MSTQEMPIVDSMITSAPAATPTGGLSAASRSVARKVWEVIAACIYRRALRRAERELMSLDDRMLNDIGVTRSEIPYAVRRAQENLLMPIVPH